MVVGLWTSTVKAGGQGRRWWCACWRCPPASWWPDPPPSWRRAARGGLQARRWCTRPRWAGGGGQASRINWSLMPLRERKENLGYPRSGLSSTKGETSKVEQKRTACQCCAVLLLTNLIRTTQFVQTLYDFKLLWQTFCWELDACLRASCANAAVFSWYLCFYFLVHFPAGRGTPVSVVFHFSALPLPKYQHQHPSCLTGISKSVCKKYSQLLWRNIFHSFSDRGPAASKPQFLSWFLSCSTYIYF